jgi:hypothetical protein
LYILDVISLGMAKKSKIDKSKRNKNASNLDAEFIKSSNLEEPAVAYSAINRESLFQEIEDGDNLSIIENLFAIASRSAYRKAVNRGNRIVTVKDGNLVVIQNGALVEVLKAVSSRKVVKGTSFTIAIKYK